MNIAHFGTGHLIQGDALLALFFASSFLEMSFNSCIHGMQKRCMQVTEIATAAVDFPGEFSFHKHASHSYGEVFCVPMFVKD